MARQGARVSLILAFVFPAIVCAAVALAYYGYSLRGRVFRAQQGAR